MNKYQAPITHKGGCSLIAGIQGDHMTNCLCNICQGICDCGVQIEEVNHAATSSYTNPSCYHHNQYTTFCSDCGAYLG